MNVTGSLDHLGPAALAVLRVAALIGPAFDFDTLRATLQQPADDLIAVLEEAAAGGIIREESDRFHFATPQIAETLRTGLLGPRRSAWHRRIAAVARDPDMVAFHLGAAGDPEAVPLLKAAGDRAMRVGARSRAAGCYRRALALSGDDHSLRAEMLLLAAAAAEPGDTVLAASLLAQAASAAAASGDAVVAAFARYAQALHLAADGNARALNEMDRAHQALAELWREPRLAALQVLICGEASHQRGAPDGLALVYLGSGRSAEAEAVVREALAEVGPHPGFFDQWVLAEAALLRGDLNAAYHEYRLSAEDAVRRRCFGAAAVRRTADTPGRWPFSWPTGPIETPQPAMAKPRSTRHCSEGIRW
ncbi:MAG: transcriptional regulator, LuxR family [Firmicutes bacterium]|nr:transcriptional regulator, LuxR family [Bacillota bacterium]